MLGQELSVRDGISEKRAKCLMMQPDKSNHASSTRHVGGSKNRICITSEV